MTTHYSHLTNEELLVHAATIETTDLEKEFLRRMADLVYYGQPHQTYTQNPNQKELFS